VTVWCDENGIAGLKAGYRFSNNEIIEGKEHVILNKNKGNINNYN
jgi:hypothetical protein